MRSITVIALGKLNAAYYREAAAEYEKRLGAFCRLRVVELAEEAIAEKSASPALIEKALLRSALRVRSRQARRLHSFWSSARSAAQGI